MVLVSSRGKPAAVLLRFRAFLPKDCEIEAHSPFTKKAFGVQPALVGRPAALVGRLGPLGARARHGSGFQQQISHCRLFAKSLARVRFSNAAVNSTAGNGA